MDPRKYWSDSLFQTPITVCTDSICAALPKEFPMADEARQKQFIQALILNGGAVAVDNHLPPAAMVACAIEESGYGTSKIYASTGCPFNLQRPSWYTWVKCDTKLIETCTKTADKGDCI
jgi:flagellum-specific peptidoglycan hydrolase FlgJ